MRLGPMVVAVFALLATACSDANTPTGPVAPDPLGSLAHGGHDRDRHRLASISGMKCLVTAARHEDDGDDDDDDDDHISRSAGRDGRENEREHGRDHGRRGRCERGDDHGIGVADWPISLVGTDREGAAVSLSTVTDARGRYAFTGLRPGTYTVCEGMQPGFVQVFPSAGASCPGDTFGYEIVLRWGNRVKDADFGNRVDDTPPPPPTATGRIEGAVLITGTPDGMSDWVVFLFDGNGALATQTATVLGGAYAFPNLPAGTYLVCEDLPVWMTLEQQSAPAAGDPGTGQCANNGTVGHLITITGAGEVLMGKDFQNAIAG